MTRSLGAVVGLLVLAQGTGYSPDHSERDFYAVRPWRGVELIIVGISRLRQPDLTTVRAGERGAVLNTNQEFIYISTARDFKNFSTDALATTMMLYAQTPRLPVAAGTKMMRADRQDLEVTVTHGGGHSRLAIKLDGRFNRTPRWIPTAWGGAVNPGSYPGYEEEAPFCGATLEAVLQELTAEGRSYRPKFYVVTYEGTPEKLAEVVVPLEFETLSAGRQIKHGGCCGPQETIHLVMFSVSPRETSLGDPNLETELKVGAYGLKVTSTREFVYGRLLVAMENSHGQGRDSPMLVDFETGKLPVSEGVHRLSVDGQDTAVRVWHSERTSRVLIRLGRKYQRTPYWWPHRWGGGYNPGDYPGWISEKPFCSREVAAVLQALTGSADQYRPAWYTVSYAAGLPELDQIPSARDLSFLGEITVTLVVPARR